MRHKSPLGFTTRETPPIPTNRRWLRWLLLVGGIASVLALAGATIAAVVAYRALAKDLPQLIELESYQPSLVTKIYARDGALLGDFFIEKRFLVPLEEIPLHVRQATIAVEDSRFYSHSGIDFFGVLRATWVNVRAGEVKEGASTITQQVARSLFLNRERTLTRKLREMILAYRIEQHFSKDKILEMYLNQIFYGHNVYGVEAAAQVYFGKPVKELTLAEGALIAGLPSAPNRFSPLKDVALSVKRREHVLRRMLEEGYLTVEQLHTAQQEPVQLSTPKLQVSHKTTYFVEYVRQYLEERYGATALYRGGFQVYTTLDIRLQQAAERALQHGVLTIDKRHGYQGTQQHVLLTGDTITNAALIAAITLPVDSDPTLHVGETLPGVVLQVSPSEATVAVKTTRGILPRDGVAWARVSDLHLDFNNRRALAPHELLRRGDVIQVRVVQSDATGKLPQLALEQDPMVQGALLAMEVGSGHVLAMVGGYDFGKSQFNRATQALRQPGSAFKPVIYAAAFEAGLTPASIIVDAPFVKEAPGQEAWKPENYTGKFYGPTTLRTALTQSRNLVTVRLLDKIGVPAAVSYARRLGITSPLAPYLSLGLGASEVTLTELTTAYGVFANEGFYVPPVFITKIVDARGEVLEERFPEAQQMVSPEIAYMMTNMLEGVIQNGTGRRVRALGRPAAGKTGTTNDFRDAWFLGYTPEIVTGVWVGMDDRTTLGYGEAGGRVASPIWLEFMQEAVRGYPITDFVIPPGVRFVRIVAESGLPATFSTAEETLFEVFLDGTHPHAKPQYAPDFRRNIRTLDRARRTAMPASSG